jgi:hypothetical protein
MRSCAQLAFSIRIITDARSFHRQGSIGQVDYRQIRDVFNNDGQGRQSFGEFRPGMRISIWGLQDAFVLGRNEAEYPDSIDLLWVDSIGVIVVMAYSLEQCRRMVQESLAREYGIQS